MNAKHYCCWKSSQSYYKRLGNLLKERSSFFSRIFVSCCPEFPSSLHTLPSFLLIFCHFSLDCALYEIEGRGEDENVLHSIIIPLHMSPAWHIPYYSRKGMYLSLSLQPKIGKITAKRDFERISKAIVCKCCIQFGSISYNINSFRPALCWSV